MGLVAEFQIDCEALPLTDVAAAVPEATLTLDIQFNHGDRPPFLVTIQDGSQSTIETAFTNAFDVGAWTLVGQADGTHRYQVLPALSFEEQLGDYLNDLAGLEALATADAIIERIEVLPSGWRQTGWFANRDTFGEFSSFWQRNAGFQLLRLTHDDESEPPGDGLTDRQREALRIAYERGYFKIPRQASLEEIAAELEISASSVPSDSAAPKPSSLKKQSHPRGPHSPRKHRRSVRPYLNGRMIERQSFSTHTSTIRCTDADTYDSK